MRLVPVAFAAIPSWADDDHLAAFEAFRRHMSAIEDAPATRRFGVDGEALLQAGRAADRARVATGAEARRFFEDRFRPFRIAAEGFLTGYYEPVVPASRKRDARFATPIYRRPPDLAEIEPASMPPDWNPAIRFARRIESGFEPYDDRAAIEAGALAGRGLELAWLETPVDAFFIHVQGSARLAFSDGAELRIGYDGKTGHPYTSIGRLAVERGLLPLAGADRDGLDRWLREHPAERVALMRENRSYIFFRETGQAAGDGPIGAAGVPLSAGRSLAVDRSWITFGTPVFVTAGRPGSSALPDLDDPARPFARLLVAADAGSAIVGPARGDLFVGAGAAAGSAAGRIRHPANLFVLVPREGTAP